MEAQKGSVIHIELRQLNMNNFPRLEDYADYLAQNWLIAYALAELNNEVLISTQDNAPVVIRMLKSLKVEAHINIKMQFTHIKMQFTYSLSSTLIDLFNGKAIGG